MRYPAPRPAPSGNILGSKVYTSAIIRTNFFSFSFLQFLDLFLSLFSSFSSLLFILIICTHIRHSEWFLEGAKLFLSSYSSLLYTIFFLFLFFSSYNLTVFCNTAKLMTCRENPAKIPVWGKNPPK